MLLFLEFVTKHNQNFVDNMNVSYLNARINFFTTLSKRIYSVFLQNDIVFRFSKYFKLRNETIAIMKRFTHDIIQCEKIRRGAKRQNSRLHLIDVLFANDYDMNSLQNQIDTFVIAVSIFEVMSGIDRTEHCLFKFQIEKLLLLNSVLQKKIIINQTISKMTLNDPNEPKPVYGAITQEFFYISISCACNYFK